MTKTEYLNSTSHNRHSKYTLKSGKVEYGIISDFFPDEPASYYLVRSPQLIEFKSLMDKEDYTGMRQLATLIDLKDVLKAELVDSFDELLLKKKEEQQNAKINWDERKETWLKSIDGFYRKINEWLDPFQKGGFLTISQKEITITEEYIGQYNTIRLDLYLGHDLISLTPRGTLIIGSYGRIDMRGPAGETFIVEPEWNQWKFAKRTPRLKYWDVTEESFKSAIQELSNG
ncbi:MAG: hypothetical protein WDO16_12715 [Bacteroidota bacterium]